MKILVTGGAGYIGSIVVEELLECSHSVTVIDNLQEGHRQAVSAGADFYQGDFGSCQLLTKIFEQNQIDAVLHFAAETTIEFSMTNPAKYFLNNVVNSVMLLEIMRKYGCNKFIFSSTAATFGEPKYTPIDENHPHEPINAYGESKLIFERILDWYYRAYDLKFMAFRYFNAAGASGSLGEDHRHESHLIPIVIQVALGKLDQVNVYGKEYPTSDGTCIRDFIHVVDLARAHILGLEKLDDYPNRKYNLGNGEGFSVLKVIQTIERVTGCTIPYRFARPRQGDPPVLLASSERAKRELGWKPTFSELEGIVESAWRWHKSHPNGYQD